MSGKGHAIRLKKSQLCGRQIVPKPIRGVGIYGSKIKCVAPVEVLHADILAIEGC